MLPEEGKKSEGEEAGEWMEISLKCQVLETQGCTGDIGNLVASAGSVYSCEWLLGCCANGQGVEDSEHGNPMV